MNAAWKTQPATPNWKWRMSLMKKGKIYVCFFCFMIYEEKGSCAICGRNAVLFIRPWQKEEKPKPDKIPDAEILSLFKEVT